MSHTLEIQVHGALLLGSGGWGGLHEITLRDADGLPFLPAAALKGALREQLVRLKDRAAADALFGHEGPSPLEAGGETRETEDAEDAGTTTHSRVFLSDGRVVEEDRHRFDGGRGYEVRTQVGLDRRKRGAMDQHLYQREVVAGSGAPLRFRADVDARRLDDEQLTWLRGATRAVFALGASKSSGLGEVEMELRQAPSPEPSEGKDASPDRTSPVALPSTDDLVLVLEATAPLCLGQDRFIGNLHRTRDHIPASTLRGALATAGLVERGLADEDRRGEPWFRRLFFDPETCLRIGPAWPVADGLESSETSSRPSFPPSAPPASLRTCKVLGEAHGHGDRLLVEYLHRLLAEKGRFVSLDPSCGHPCCKERQVPANRPVGSAEPLRRLVTRVGLDARTGQAERGRLFSLELLERGTRFAFRVSGADAEAREFLHDALCRGLRVGHGRGQGYGAMRLVEALPFEDGETLAERLQRFDDEVRRRLDVLDLGPLEPGSGSSSVHFTALLQSPLVPSATEGSAENAFLDALGLPPEVEIVHSAVRAGQRGGWNEVGGGPKSTRPTVRAGSVLLLRAPQSFDELLSRLRALEVRGGGQATEEGFGWIRFSDPIHHPDWRKP